LKNFEDRAWEDMVHRLNDSLPNHSPMSKRYWIPVAVAILAFVLGGYILLDNFILNQSSNVILAQKDESFLLNDHQHNVAIKEEVRHNDVVKSSKSFDNNDDSKYYAGAVTKPNRQNSRNQGDQQLMLPGYTYITQSDDNSQVKSNVSSTLVDDKNDNSISLSASEYNGAKHVSTFNSTFNSENGGELSLLESKEIQTVDIPESPLKKFESLTFDTKKLGRNWNFSFALGSFANAAIKYSGIQATPAASYFINKKNAISVRVPVWVRHTRDDKIVEDVNQKLNASLRQDLFVPENIDIVSQKVNSVTVDAGIALGYSHRINQKISLTTSGIARYENISGLIQASSRIQGFSKNTNHAYESIDKMYAAKNDGWSYGANIELDYHFTPKHSVYGTVAYMNNKKSDFEIGIGYSYRIH